MTPKASATWFSGLSVILMLWGVVFAFFGLGVLPVLDRSVLLHWESALYGAIMLGWGLTLLFIGRIALLRHDLELITALLYGIVLWLVVEGLFSAYLGVWFNVGVDVVVLGLFSYPLVSSLRSPRRENP